MNVVQDDHVGISSVEVVAPPPLAPMWDGQSMESCQTQELEERGPARSGKLSWYVNAKTSSGSSCTVSHNSHTWVPQLQPLFLDGEEMKQKVRNQLVKKAYTVTDMYKEQGMWQGMARSAVFEHITLLVIGINAIWIAYDTDNNRASVLYKAEPQFQIAEIFFFSFFFIEWLIRFMSFKRKKDGLSDVWFTLDTFLVLVMMVDTVIVTLIVFFTESESGGGAGDASILRIVRLLRLTRVARLARLLRATPELMIIVKGMAAALRSVFFTLCLLFIVLYVFAIALTQLSIDHPLSTEYFGSVMCSMYSLLLHGAFADNLSIVAYHVGQESWLIVTLFIICVLLGAFTVMNLLIGVLCDVVSAVACAEREQIAVALVKEKMQGIVSQIDTDGNNMISKAEFQEIMSHQDAVKALEEVDVDVCGLVDLAELIFEDDDGAKRMVRHEDQQNTAPQIEAEGSKEISFEDFMSMVLELRNTNTATVKDIMTLRRYNRHCFLRLSAQLDINNKLLAATAHYLKNIQQPKKAHRQRSRNRASSRSSSPDDDLRVSPSASQRTEETERPSTGESPPDSPSHVRRLVHNAKEGLDSIGLWSPMTGNTIGRVTSTETPSVAFAAQEDLPKAILEQARSWTPIREGTLGKLAPPMPFSGSPGNSLSFEEHRERVEQSLRKGLEELEDLCEKLCLDAAPQTQGIPGAAERDAGGGGGGRGGGEGGRKAAPNSSRARPPLNPPLPSQPPLLMPGVPDCLEPAQGCCDDAPQPLRAAATAAGPPPRELKDQVRRLGDTLELGLREALAMSGKRRREPLKQDDGNSCGGGRSRHGSRER